MPCGWHAELASPPTDLVLERVEIPPLPDLKLNLAMPTACDVIELRLHEDVYETWPSVDGWWANANTSRW